MASSSGGRGAVSRDADRRVAENRSGREDTVSLERADRPRGPTAWTDRVDRPRGPTGGPARADLVPFITSSWLAAGRPAETTPGLDVLAHIDVWSASGGRSIFLVHTRLAPTLEFPFHTRRRRQPSHFFISFIRYTHTAMRRASPTQLSLKANTNSGLFLVSTNKTRSGRARVVLSPQCRAVRSLLPTNARSKGREMAGTRRIVGQRLQLRFSPTVAWPLTTYVPHPRLHPLTHPPVPDYHRRARCDRCRSR